MRRKLLALWIYFMLIFTQPVYCQNYQQKINIADSLYNHKNYPDALHEYEDIFQKSEKYSLAMLLKMSFLYETSGNYSKALFYLNIFYRDQPDKRVLEQMEFLAEKYNLKGYRYTDLEYFISLYNEYYTYIIIYILSGSFAFCVYLLLKKIQKKKLGVLRPLIFISILTFVYYITNYRVIPPRAIVAHKNAVLMSAPSAAARVLSIAGEGHRVTIHNKNDIWYEISWENGKAYIREDDLYLIPVNQKSLF